MHNSAVKLLRAAVEAHRRGAKNDAKQLYFRVLELNPASETACTQLATLAMEAGDFANAEKMFKQAVDIKPNSASAHYNLGFIFHERERFDAAGDCYRRAIELRPDFVEAYNNLGIVLQQQSRLDEAILVFRRAISWVPHRVDAYFNLGAVLAQQLRFDEAAVAYRHVLQLAPNHPQARRNLAIILSQEGHFQAAHTMHQQLITESPNNPEYYNNLGASLLEQGRTQDAIDSLEGALKLNPDYAEAHFNIGNAFRELGDLEAAIRAYRAVLSLRAAHAPALAQLFYHCALACDWSDREVLQEQLHAAVHQGGTDVPPFTLLSTSATATDQMLCARNWAKNFIVADEHMLPQRAAKRPDRLRVGYLSSDFHAHATAHLLAETIERHDRGGFEIYAYSYGPERSSAMRARLVAAFDRFIDIDPLSHRDAAELIRTDEIDILVDLKGYTNRSRPKILAFRPAPVQINYLGYPGTMGAPFIDYVIADKFTIPPGQQRNFTEAVAYLPDCYQPNDSRREIATSRSRAESGLPTKGFVFCAFNNSFKIVPAFFAVWMRLLRNVPESVLWLLESNPLMRRNLTAAAIGLGIDPARLIFAPTLPQSEHLARYVHADLFLDTLPCCAHTTASDALWVGLPIVTCDGDTFAGRVAGSILSAAGLSELITHSIEEYEQLALSLAQNPDRVVELRARVRSSRNGLPLFHTAKYTKDLESLYSRIFETRRSGTKRSPISLGSA